LAPIARRHEEYPALLQLPALESRVAKQALNRIIGALDPWLIIVVAVAAFLRFGRITDFDNSYYTATAVSITKSWHNFLFASFDPGGAVSVDKPPLALWVQAGFTMVFGPHKWAVNLPQAILGTASVALLYFLIRPVFGRLPAIAAAAVLATLPAAIVIDSRNEPDGILMFLLLAGAIALVKSVRGNSLPWLLLSALLVGAAFNTKMLVAFVPLPAFALYYWVASRDPVVRKALKSAAAGSLLLVVSFAWPLFVALTPASDRPYVGSTRDNSIWSLVFEYNGLHRFNSFGGPRPRPGVPQPPAGQVPGAPQSGQQPGGPPLQQPPAGQVPGAPQSGQQPGGPPLQQPPAGQVPGGAPQPGRQPGGPPLQQPPAGQVPGGAPQPGRQPGGPPLQQPPGGQPQGGPPGQPFQPPPGPQSNAGSGGVLGLFRGQLAAQTGWLLPAALALSGVAMIPLLSRDAFFRPRTILESLQSKVCSETVLWAAWLITSVVVFGLADATGTHPYYLVGLGLPMAAVAGLGIGAAWSAFKGNGIAWSIVAIALVAIGVQQALTTGALAGEVAVAAILLALAAASTVLLVAAVRQASYSPLANAAAVAGGLALLVIPAMSGWRAGARIAGLAGSRPPPAGAQFQPSIESQLRTFIKRALEQDPRPTGRYVLAAQSAREVAPFIIDGIPAIAVGGFSGSDPILSVEAFRAMASGGDILYFLVPRQDQPGGPRQQPVIDEVRRSWRDVSSEAGLPAGSLYRYR